MTTPEQKWQKCLGLIKNSLQSPDQFDSWFKPLSLVRLQDNELTVAAPSQYFVEQIEERFFPHLERAIREVFGQDISLYYSFNQIGGDPTSTVTMETSKASQAVKPKGSPVLSNPFAPRPMEDIDPNLNPTYTFENYCESHSNRMALSIGEAIAKNPKMKTFNPLFVFGPPGVGKTHLIQAIGIRIKENNPSMRVLYLTARMFETQYTSAVTAGKVNDFIYFYQSVDVLIIDDIQDLAGKKHGTQNAFFHIFNHLHQNLKQIILSSDQQPSAMEGLEERMLSRFKWGIVAELERPDYDLRRSVLTLKARQDGIVIPVEVMEYIANNVTDSIRTLEGIVVSLLANATFLNRDITLELARNVVSKAVKVSRHQVNFEMIVQSVADFYDIDSELIFSKTRKRQISDARQIVMYLAKKLAKMQLAAIGTRLLRTHSTVIHAYRNIEERLQIDKQLQGDMSKIESSLIG